MESWLGKTLEEGYKKAKKFLIKPMLDSYEFVEVPYNQSFGCRIDSFSDKRLQPFCSTRSIAQRAH
ncbi:hypothetical protein [Pseudomonas sp. StFLB209]|uniref:hypothetical protein n=1 Tax=Pseudomonas sp. StFLB209 TaxID=1028989 RepID=UPI001E34AB3D|nr:hypothetical protein [Pseudomonas sp. StFLB209]